MRAVVDVHCGKGTYVRALARDLGAAVGVGGHLTALRRTRVGPFTLAEARTLEQVATLEDPVMVPLAQAVRASMHVRALTGDEATDLSYGKTIAARGIPGVHGGVTPDGVVIALLEERDGRARPVVVFAPAG